jgi:hypothetical protein
MSVCVRLRVSVGGGGERERCIMYILLYISGQQMLPKQQFENVVFQIRPWTLFPRKFLEF